MAGIALPGRATLLLLGTGRTRRVLDALHSDREHHCGSLRFRDRESRANATFSGQRGGPARVGLVDQDNNYGSRAMVVLWVLTGLGRHCLCGLQTRCTSLFCRFALFVIGGVVLSTLAIPILCGMVIRRGITAGMVALLVLVLVLPVLSGLFAMGMLPRVFFLLVPLAFLAVSFAWSRDWLLDRPGARRWVKLAVLLVGCFGALFAAYVAVRVLGVPTLDPAPRLRSFSSRRRPASLRRTTPRIFTARQPGPHSRCRSKPPG